MILLAASLGTAVAGNCQSNTNVYLKLKSQARKPNIIHFGVNLGLGMNFFNSLRNHMTGTSSVNGQTSPYNNYASDQSRGLPTLIGSLNADLVETNKYYLGVDGSSFFSYSPYKIGSVTPDANGNIFLEKGNSLAYSFEGLIKIGTGAAKFKIYIGLGIGKMHFESYANGSSALTTTGIVSYGTSKDSIRTDLSYEKAIVGFRIGSNRNSVVDISFYKWVMGGSFFANMQSPGGIKSLTYFGKYERHPPLPYGLSASYIKPGKYKIETSLQFFRDNATVEKNASLVTISIAKNIDFYNHKIK